MKLKSENFLWINNLNDDLQEKIKNKLFLLSNSSSLLNYSFLSSSLNKEIDPIIFQESNEEPKKYDPISPPSILYNKSTESTPHSTLDTYHYCREFSKKYSDNQIDLSHDTLLISWSTNYFLQQSYTHSNPIIQEKILSLPSSQESLSESKALLWWGIKNSEFKLVKNIKKDEEIQQNSNKEKNIKSKESNQERGRSIERNENNRTRSRSRNRSKSKEKEKYDRKRSRSRSKSRDIRDRSRDRRRRRDNSRESYRNYDKYSNRSRDRRNSERGYDRDRGRYSDRSKDRSNKKIRYNSRERKREKNRDYYYGPSNSKNYEN